MSDAPLPDNLEDWPHDPYELFGLKSSASWSEIRKAYAQLIHYYKPERFPAEFQRVRTAYETLQSRQSSTAAKQREPPPAEFSKPPQPKSQEDVAPQPAPLEKHAPFEQRLQQVTQAIGTGPAEDGYRRLLELEAEKPGHPDVCLRLYWLTSLQRQLASTGPPADWLLKSLLLHPEEGPVWNVWQLELELRPESALLPGCERLVTEGPPDDFLEAFIGDRWSALAELHRWSKLAEDVNLLEQRFSFAEPVFWASLLFQAVQQTLWETAEDARALCSQCQRTLHALPDISLLFDYEFDQLEIQVESLLTLGQYKEQLSNEIFALLAACWNPQSSRFRRLVGRICRHWDAADPELTQTWQLLERACPLAATRLCRSLQKLVEQADLSVTSRKRTWMIRTLEEFFSPSPVRAGSRVRSHEVVQLCLQFLIPVPLLVQLAWESALGGEVAREMSEIQLRPLEQFLIAGCVAGRTVG